MRGVLFAIVGALTALLLGGCSVSGGAVVSAGVSVPAGHARVATVDGLAVVVGEVERELRRTRGTGSTDQAMRKLVEIKVQQAMMLERGIIETADYGSYLASLAKENARREAALSKGEAVYGPTKLEPDFYFGYRFDTEVIALKERLRATELHASDVELRAFYVKTKQRLGNSATETTADVLTFTKGGEKKEIDFERDKERIHALWVDEEYRQLVQRRARQAEVDIDHDVLVRIPSQ